MNDEIQQTSHSRFLYITRGNIKMLSNVRREVDEVREERLIRRRERDRLRGDLERETSEERHTRFVNFLLFNYVLHNGTRGWLGEENVTETEVQRGAWLPVNQKGKRGCTA